MKANKLKSGVALLATLLSACSPVRQGVVEAYITTETQSSVFEQTAIPFDPHPFSKAGTNPTIVIRPDIRYQEMEGFGAAITGSSCYNLLKMPAEARAALLKETFDPVEGMGYSYIRISIGCSDFSMDEYTCCDTPGIEHFAIHELDKRDLYPILREILAINPEIQILASPWTPPRWMKVNNLTERKPFNSWTDGQLNPDCYADYGSYFVRFIQEMKAEGFTINAITIQNEPLNRGNSASLFMTWQEQRDFIKTALGPQLRTAGLDTEIWAYDHNYNYDSHKEDCVDQVGYPLHIYQDAEAAQYIAGAAYHAYGGEVSELANIHAARPDKGIYFTEMSIGLWGDGYSFAGDFMWNMREVCLGSINNYGKAVMMWNYMLDDKHAPYRPGGCNMCLGCIDIHSADYTTLTRNSHYYTLAHLSKVIKPKALRLGSNLLINGGIEPLEGLYYAPFLNPDGSYSLVLQNDSPEERMLTIAVNGYSFTRQVPAKSVISYLWK